MPRRLSLHPHLTADELHQRYRRCTDPVARSHFQILWLFASNHSVPETARVAGYSQPWVRALIRRYNDGGPDALGDQRHHNPGATPLLDARQQAWLLQALDAPPPDGGLWNGPKVAQWMSDLLDRPVSPQRGWDYLRLLGYRLRVPRPRHRKADDRLQAEWKQQLAEEVARLRQQYPHAELEVWAMDEHRLGLIPVTRRVWVREGERPEAEVQWRREWLWVHGFVRPDTGETWWWLLPKVNSELMVAALSDLAQARGLGADKQMLLVLDRAGWHTSKQVEENLPEGMHLLLLPPYSPELQPAERLWRMLDEPVANRSFCSLEKLEAVVEERCRWMMRQLEAVAGLTNFHWWADAL